jgi:CHAT domain-containing protein
LEEIEEALGEEQALLSFHLIVESTRGHEHSWLLVHTSGNTVAYEIPFAGQLNPATEMYSSLLLRRDGSEAWGAEQLYEDLLGPALRDLPPGVTDLMIAPDAALHRLPFGALRPPGGGEPLGARYTISLVPSATLWLRWKEAGAAPAAKPALALSDPVLPGVEEADSWRGGDLTAVARLAALPHARRETGVLRRHLGRSTTILEGESATESAFKGENLSRYGIIHMATHAVVDERYPERTAMILGSTGADDGLLQLREVVALDMSGTVVVLSGCRSASGPVLGGEGVLGLARAFFVADARAVVGSLWPLRDDEAAVLFDDFYRHLGKGESLAGALRAARRDRIAAGAPPAAWAGLVLLGDGSLVPFPGGVRSDFEFWIVALGVVLLLFVGVIGIRWSWRRRSRRRLLAVLPDRVST